MSKIKEGFKNLFASVAGKTPVRMLSDHPVEGVRYKANQVVLFPDVLVKELSGQGVVDAAPAAVEYCINELGVKVIEHAAVQPVTE